MWMNTKTSKPDTVNTSNKLDAFIFILDRSFGLRSSLDAEMPN
jgi:hypothetical protein